MQGTPGKKKGCTSGCLPEHKVCCGGCVNRGQTVVTTTTFSKKLCSNGIDPVTIAYVTTPAVAAVAPKGSPREP